MTSLNIDINHQNQSKKSKILGIGTPFIDYLLDVSDDYLDSIHVARGGATLIDYVTLQKTLEDYPPNEEHTATGGSSANTIKGLAKLGHNCAFSGKIGCDAAANKFSQKMNAYGVASLLSSSELPTAQAACLITPDHERTMRAFLGAGTEMNATDFSKEIFQNIKLVHIEGYLLTRPGLVEKSMNLAQISGAKISFDLSSFEIVKHYKQQLFDLLSHYVNIIFANEDEAHMLTGLPPNDACDFLKSLCDIAIVKHGSQGSYAASGIETAFQPAHQVDVIDTTGAGDLFASGFLHGYLKNKSLEKCLLYGTHVASQVIQVSGAEIPERQWPEIIKKLK